MFKRTLTTFLVAALLATPALAQDGDGSKPAPRPTERVDAKDPPVRKADPDTGSDAERSDDAAAEEVAPITGVRYRVLLKTGRELIGVIRERGVFERTTVGSGYVSADPDEPGAGIRVWYPGNQDGFVFLSVDEVEQLEELGALTLDQGRELARARIAARERFKREQDELRRRSEAEAAAAAERLVQDERDAADGDTSGEQPADADGSNEPAPKPDVAEKSAAELAKLLVEFPPKRWTLKTPLEIERRKVVLGLFPSDEERRFLAVFADWKRAYQASKADDK